MMLAGTQVQSEINPVTRKWFLIKWHAGAFPCDGQAQFSGTCQTGLLSGEAGLGCGVAFVGPSFWWLLSQQGLGLSAHLEYTPKHADLGSS